MRPSFAATVERVLRAADVTRLRGDAKPNTHLARYQLAHNANASRVLVVACPECGACAESQCKGAS